MKMKIALASVAACLMATSASAVTFGGTATGAWTNPIGTTGFTIGNNDGSGGDATVNWGTPATTAFDNQWTFNGAGSDGGPGWSADDGVLFNFGDFSYRNGSVTDHDFGGASLAVTLSILVPAAIGSTVFNFDFTVINTANSTGDPVLDGDIASIIGGVSDQSFSYGGQNYTLSLIGFSSDGGNTLTTQFNSPEGSTAYASLYGRIDVAAVPLPATLSLGLMALGGLGIASRRRKNKA